MILDAILKNNLEYLKPKIVKVYEELYSDEILFLAGSGLSVGRTEKRSKESDKGFYSLAVPKTLWKEIFKDTSIKLRSKMSNNVTKLVWNRNAWYSDADFIKYKAYLNIISWDSFMYPLVILIQNELQKGNISEAGEVEQVEDDSYNLIEYIHQDILASNDVTMLDIVLKLDLNSLTLNKTKNTIEYKFNDKICSLKLK